MWWPPRSPDLSPLDFFSLVLFEKSCLCKKKSTNLFEVSVNIRNEIGEINKNKDLLENVWGNFVTRLEKCKSMNGGHLEFVLNKPTN